MEPQELYQHVRKLIEAEAHGNADDWWYTNRYVYARLALDELKTKTAIKRLLLDEKGPCHFCGKPFSSRKGIPIHRLDQQKGYSKTNCVLAHQECHEQFHAKASESVRPDDGGSAVVNPSGVISKHSKLYDGSFLYWWDITPALAERMDQYEAIEFVCDDTRESCLVQTDILKPLLTTERQTTRGAGHWGIRVRKGHEDEIAIEPGRGKGEWTYIPVAWLDRESDE